MPKRALIEKRPWLVASITAATAYYFLHGGRIPGLFEIALKGAGVALLAVYALVRHRGTDSRQIAAVMVFGALGDMAIEYRLEAGAAAFLIGHLIAIHLYLRHRRTALTISEKATGAALLVLTPLVSVMLPDQREGVLLLGVYSLGLGAMAAAAWTSSFPRYRVGIGAVLFVASDLLIFSRFGPLAESAVPGLLIWPLYYFGQFLICTGVVGELRNRQREDRVFA